MDPLIPFLHRPFYIKSFSTDNLQDAILTIQSCNYFKFELFQISYQLPSMLINLIEIIGFWSSSEVRFESIFGGYNTNKERQTISGGLSSSESKHMEKE